MTSDWLTTSTVELWVIPLSTTVDVEAAGVFPGVEYGFVGDEPATLVADGDGLPVGLVVHGYRHSESGRW